jgi:hypothetical protein
MSLNLLEPSRPIQACNGIALPFYNRPYLSLLNPHVSHLYPPAKFLKSLFNINLFTSRLCKYLYSLFFHRACFYRTLFKIPTHALCFKIHIKTQSLYKTLECLRLLCHPTCFGHTLDHLQGMFLVQCCFPPCCFVTTLQAVCFLQAWRLKFSVYFKFLRSLCPAISTCLF